MVTQRREPRTWVITRNAQNYLSLSSRTDFLQWSYEYRKSFVVHRYIFLWLLYVLRIWVTIIFSADICLRFVTVWEWGERWMQSVSFENTNKLFSSSAHLRVREVDNESNWKEEKVKLKNYAKLSNWKFSEREFCSRI